MEIIESTFWEGRVSVFFFFFFSLHAFQREDRSYCSHYIITVHLLFYTVHPLFMSLFVAVELENDCLWHYFTRSHSICVLNGMEVRTTSTT